MYPLTGQASSKLNLRPHLFAIHIQCLKVLGNLLLFHEFLQYAKANLSISIRNSFLSYKVLAGCNVFLIPALAKEEVIIYIGFLTTTIESSTSSFYVSM